MASSSLQPMSVKWILPVSSSSSLTRQQRPQPSHRLSHSAEAHLIERLGPPKRLGLLVFRRHRRSFKPLVRLSSRALSRRNRTSARSTLGKVLVRYASRGRHGDMDFRPRRRESAAQNREKANRQAGLKKPDHARHHSPRLLGARHGRGPSRAARPLARDRTRARERGLSDAGARRRAARRPCGDRARPSEGLHRSDPRGDAETGPDRGRSGHVDVAGHATRPRCARPAAPSSPSTK